MSQLAFPEREWPADLDAASKAEPVVHADPRTACFYARRALSRQLVPSSEAPPAEAMTPASIVP